MSGAVSVVPLIFVPLLAAFFAFVFPRQGRFAVLGTVLTMPPLLIMAIMELVHQGPLRHPVGGWGMPLGIDLYMDGLTAFMLLTTCVICCFTLVYAKHYFDQGNESRFFWPLGLLLWTALNALFLAADIFNLYVTLELLGLTAVALTALTGQRASLNAALRYLFVGLLASGGYLLGVALLYGGYGLLDLQMLASTLRAEPVSYIALVMMTVALLTKSALFPFHFWLPPAHANAAAPVSALLSALVVKASFYMLLRLWFQLFPDIITPLAANLIGGLGAAAILWGSLQALRQIRIKLMVAYSTVAQLGYLFLVFPLAAAGQTEAAIYGVLYLVLAHACAKSAMFLGTGTVMHAAGHDRMDEIQGLAKHMPVTVFTFALAGISLMGLPPSGGFVAKWSLLVAAMESGQWGWAIILLTGSLLAAAYLFKLLSPTLLQRGVGGEIADERQWPAMIWPAFLLALIAVALGFFSPLFFDLIAIGMVQ